MLGEFLIIRAKVRNLFKSIFKSSDLILDVGCGENPYYHESISSKIVCADIKPTKTSHLVGDAMALPIKKEKFNGVISVNSLYYCSDPFKAVKEFSNILKKGGKLVLMMPFMYPIHDAPDDKYRFTKYGIIELLKNNFDIKSIKTIGGIFNLPAVFFHSLMKGMPLMVSKNLRTIVKPLCIILFYPFYILAQFLSILDCLDKSGRWPTYYFAVAVKK